MKFYCSIYMDSQMKSKEDEIRKKIENDEWQFEIYLIALTKNKTNHLEIFHSALILQKTISKDDIFLVGIAGGYQEALELVEKIVQEVYDETKGADIRNYILQKQQEYEEGNV